jgi:ectoine hydroxylase-related dioxygenase (phytanoyl-CoA dioxygenase family)
MEPDRQLLNEFERDGVVVVPKVLPSSQHARLKELLDQCIRDDVLRWDGHPHYRDHWMVLNLMARHVDFARLMENEVIQAYLCAILGEACIVYAYTSSSMPPGGSNYSRRVHVDCPRVIPGYVTNVGVMLALDDFTDDNGATQFLRGSQNRTSPPTDEEFNRDATKVYPKAGDMVLFNGRTWHMGGRNVSSAPRHALTINACRSYMRQQFDYPRLVPQAIVDALGPVGRRFLGMHVRMPTCLEEYYVPPERRVYLAGQG